ncbi:MAG: ferritin-like domain-containing protein [Acidobacteriota bacterium]|nr:ferritin-like domain-containing protein [Blastocatellia bacterium]MDW8411948.1 ferritin-like domain-containing protein [Acidobacteriota bacterium]
MFLTDLTYLALEPQTKAKDSSFLAAAIQLEQKAINTYQAAISKDLLKTPNLLDIAVDFVYDHSHHRDRLYKAMRIYFSATPPLIENLGHFPLPDSTAEKDLLNYFLKLELFISKTYFDAAANLASSEARNVVASTLPIELQHVAAYRTILFAMMKEKGDLVPFSLFSKQTMPTLP